MMATDKIPTKASENRRSNKPIMEKRRRARINNCLNDLKTLILEAMKKDPARHSKLEKADILEMTVKYLQSLQRQQMALAVATDPTVLSKYRAGFSECANEVSRYVARTEGVEPSVRTRLLNHLTSCLTALSPGIGSMASSGSVVSPVHIQIPGHNPSNTSVNLIPPVDLVGGIQLLPSRLPSGEIAFLLPSHAQLPAGQIVPLYSPTVSCAPTTSTSQNSTSSGPSSTTITSSAATKPLTVAVPSPVSSNTSTLSPVGSDFSDSSSTPTPSPTPSSHRQCLPSPAMEPENLSMRVHPDSDKLCWRPWF